MRLTLPPRGQGRTRRAVIVVLVSAAGAGGITRLLLGDLLGLGLVARLAGWLVLFVFFALANLTDVFDQTDAQSG